MEGRTEGSDHGISCSREEAKKQEINQEEEEELYLHTLLIPLHQRTYNQITYLLHR